MPITLMGLEIEMVRHDWGEHYYVDQNDNGSFCRLKPGANPRYVSYTGVSDFYDCGGYAKDIGITGLPKGWYLAEDGTIPDIPYGVELTSPRLTIAQMMRQMPIACKAMMDHGYIAGPPEFCGIHISIGHSLGVGRGLGNKVFRSIKQLKYYNSYPEELYHTPISREDIRFCRKLIGNGKQHGVNADLHREGRIEFRMFGSSLDADGIREAIKACFNVPKNHPVKTLEVVS